MFLSNVVSSKLEVRKLDVKISFLHGFLQEDVYMSRPHVFIYSLYPQHVCLLNKSLYDLNQVPIALFDRFNMYLLHLGFISSKSDPSLFYFANSQRQNISLIICG